MLCTYTKPLYRKSGIPQEVSRQIQLKFACFHWTHFVENPLSGNKKYRASVVKLKMSGIRKKKEFEKTNHNIYWNASV